MARTGRALGYTPAPVNLRDWKHSRQNTGRPCVGRNGTVVSLPHAEQLVVVSTRSRADRRPPAEGRDARFALHDLQRFGSFLKFLSAKNSCSPAVQTNSAPQSTQLSDLVLELHRSYLSRLRPSTRAAGATGLPVRPRRDRTAAFRAQFDFAALLLARTLPRERLFGAAPVARLQIEGMLLDILDDIFLLHLPLEAAKRAFDRLAFLHFHFSQT